MWSCTRSLFEASAQVDAAKSGHREMKSKAAGVITTTSPVEHRRSKNYGTGIMSYMRLLGWRMLFALFCFLHGSCGLEFWNRPHVSVTCTLTFSKEAGWDHHRQWVVEGRVNGAVDTGKHLAWENACPLPQKIKVLVDNYGDKPNHTHTCIQIKKDVTLDVTESLHATVS